MTLADNHNGFQGREQQGRFLGQLLDTSPHAIITYQAVRAPQEHDQYGAIIDMRTVFFNAAYEGMFREPAESIHHYTFRQRFTGEEDTDLFPFYVQCLETGQGFRRERYYPQLGKWLDVSGTVSGDGFMVVLSDITERKTAELAAQQTNERLQAIINSIPAGINLLSPVCDSGGQLIDFQYDLVNTTVAAYVGQTPQVLQEGHISDWFPSYYGNGNFEIYRRVYQTGQAEIFEQHYQGDGQDVWISTLVKKLGAQLLMTFTDLTQVRQAAEALQVANQDLARSNERLERFAYVVSHDLQEPLRKIQSFGDMLGQQYGDQLGEGKPYLERMQSAASRMSTLIKDLLAFSKITTYRDANTPVALNPLVDSVLTTLELVIAETGAQVAVDPLPTIRGDASQLGQLFQNLLGNALKFRRMNLVPMIQVRAQRVAATDLPAGVEPGRLAAQYHRIDVADNGVGFEEKYLDRIFQVFQRLHNKGAYAGTGIGLAICEKVVANHGGAITASSQPGQGATFTIYLPA